MTSHLDHLRDIGREDAEFLLEREKGYKGSWKKRGGVGAFMMLARKWDRIENRTEGHGFDIFAAIKERGLEDKEGVIDDLRDLRRYLMLVEAEIRAQNRIPTQTGRIDNSGQDNPFGFDFEEDIAGANSEVSKT